MGKFTLTLVLAIAPLLAHAVGEMPEDYPEPERFNAVMDSYLNGNISVLRNYTERHQVTEEDLDNIEAEPMLPVDPDYITIEMFYFIVMGEHLKGACDIKEMMESDPWIKVNAYLSLVPISKKVVPADDRYECMEAFDAQMDLGGRYARERQLKGIPMAVVSFQGESTTARFQDVKLHVKKIKMKYGLD